VTSEIAVVLLACGLWPALFVYVVFRLLKCWKDWDVERGRYVAALLAQSKMGDGVASTVVRPRPQSGPVRSEPPDKVIYQEGM